eukprot:356941-Chlamydomonas_euryale.AAC.3
MWPPAWSSCARVACGRLHGHRAPAWHVAACMSCDYLFGYECTCMGGVHFSVQKYVHGLHGTRRIGPAWHLSPTLRVYMCVCAHARAHAQAQLTCERACQPLHERAGHPDATRCPASAGRARHQDADGVDRDAGAQQGLCSAHGLPCRCACKEGIKTT